MWWQSADLWNGIIGNCVAGFLLGGVFTFVWGLIGSRRESLQAQIAMLTTWMDELTSSASEYFQMSRQVVAASQGQEVPERLQVELTEALATKGARMYAALARAYSPRVVQAFAGVPEVSRAIQEYEVVARKVMIALNQIRPFEHGATARVASVEEMLKEFLPGGERPLNLLFREMRLPRVLRHVCCSAP